jgi:polyisoprenoid-binding protein YceI
MDDLVGMEQCRDNLTSVTQLGGRPVGGHGDILLALSPLDHSCLYDPGMNNLHVNTGLAAGTWSLDQATSVGFEAKVIFGLKAKGHFDRHEATITVGESAADSSISVTVWTDSVQTGISKRDEHLRAENVFASARFPTLEFNSLSVKGTPTALDVVGTLRVRDVTRRVSFHAVRSDAAGGAPRYVAELVITPKDYGITRRMTTKPLKVVIDATLRKA